MSVPSTPRSSVVPHSSVAADSSCVPLVHDRHLVIEAPGAKPLSVRTRRWIGNIAAAAAVGALGLIGVPMLMHADNPSASTPAAVTTSADSVTGNLVTAP